MLSLCEKIINTLKNKKLTLSTAESCTGGLVAKSLTDVSGASNVFYGGVVSYDNSVKENILGVRSATLKANGAVSHETAMEMAIGVKKALKTDIGISTTGIAGPGGGTKDKPVGTVYVGIAYKSEVKTFLLQIDSSLSREEIRLRACLTLLELLLEKIT